MEISEKSKLGRCFKKIGKEVEKKIVEGLISDFYKNIHPNLKKISSIVNNLDIDKITNEIYENESNPMEVSNEWDVYALRKNPEFMDLYNKLNNHYIEDFIQEKILPILK